jgi:parvulin-like peptidyl-prolyl isomerase
MLLPLCVGIGLASENPAAPATPSEPQIVELIVAKVNNEIITRGEINRARQQLEAELKRQGVAAPKLQEILSEAENDLLREKIDQLLLVQKAKDLNISVDAEVSKYLGEMQLQLKMTDPDKFQAFVREQTGTPFEDYKQQVKDNILTRRVIQQEVGSRIVIPRAEIQKYYDEHKDEFVREEQVFLREIFLSIEGKDEAAIAAIEKKAKDIVARARKGENFGTLARDNSEATTAQNMGELGAFKRGDLKKDIEEIVFREGRGYVTDPLRQSNGFVILKVEERYAAGLQPFEAVENEIMGKLYEPRMTPAVREYLTKLRQDAFLEIRAGFVDSGAAPGKDTSWKDPVQFKPATVTKEEVASQTRRRRLLWLIPIPGTETSVREENTPPSTPEPAAPPKAPEGAAATAKQDGTNN